MVAPRLLEGFFDASGSDPDDPNTLDQSTDRLRLYIDTSVLGGCFDSECATWSSGLFATSGPDA